MVRSCVVDQLESLGDAVKEADSGATALMKLTHGRR